MRLFVFDVDGTLISRDGIFKESTINTLNELLDNGEAIAIASGRPYLGIMQFLSRLHDGVKFSICANGGEIRNYQGKTLNMWPLKLKDMNVFIKNHQDIYNHEHTNIYAYLPDRIAYYKNDVFIEGETKYNGNFPGFDIAKENINENENILKFMVASSKEYSLVLEKLITKEEREQYQIVRSAPIFVEFIRKDADKATAVKYLADYLNVSFDKVYTFGDSGNDYLMIKTFNGVAMGNAIEECKKVAKFVTKSVDEDGVTFAIKNLI